MTSADLLGLAQVGRNSATEIIAFALQSAAKNLASRSDGAAASLSAAELPSAGAVASGPLPGLTTLARWAICIGAVATIGETLDLLTSHVPPEDVAEAFNELRSVSLTSLPEVSSTIADAYQFLLAQCNDDRQRDIFRHRISLKASTLEELGEKWSITRARVGQIQQNVQKKLSEALQCPEASEVRWRAAQLRQELGTAIPWNSLATRNALRTACRGLDQHGVTADELLLWLAGPYRLEDQTGWLFKEQEYSHGTVGPRSEVGPPARAAILEAVSDEGIVNIEAARNRAAAAGLVPDAIDDWIALCPFRDFDGTVLLWNGSVVDKAAALLGMFERPATADELNGMIAEGHSVRGLRNRLLDDKRFVRTDRFRFGLRRWGLEEYSGIVDEIEEEIARRGGEADIYDLVQTLTERFGLRAGSVVSYTTVPRFVVNNGRIRVRRADEPFVPARTLFDEAHAFLLDEDRCTYRVRVDGDVLRGSGRSLPQGVGAWLGVLPGNRRQFRFQDGNILLISWPDSALLGPALGSLRRQTVALSADAGDFLLLEFDRSSDSVEARLVRQRELDAATGWLRGTLLTGIDAGGEKEFEQLLARAVGASSSAELNRRCRDRGDPELCSLLPAKSSPELDDALERLKDVL